MSTNRNGTFYLYSTILAYWNSPLRVYICAGSRSRRMLMFVATPLPGTTEHITLITIEYIGTRLSSTVRGHTDTGHNGQRTTRTISLGSSPTDHANAQMKRKIHKRERTRHSRPIAHTGTTSTPPRRSACGVGRNAQTRNKLGAKVQKLFAGGALPNESVSYLIRSRRTYINASDLHQRHPIRHHQDPDATRHIAFRLFLEIATVS